MIGAVPQPVFSHLLRLTDHRATFEHALLAEPRRDHGYCTDDMARVLVVTAREPEPTAEVKRLATNALSFLGRAQWADGTCHNRMSAGGHWTDAPSTDDHWGRAIWGLGTAAAHSPVEMVRRLAAIQFERAAVARSPHRRAMAFAAIGAAELLGADQQNVAALKLLADYSRSVPRAPQHPEWPWPEPRLTYGNATLAEAMIAAGVALHHAPLRQRGLDALRWLLGVETSNGHLSPTPVAGRGPEDSAPGFDQQPIEVASLAEACARAAATDSSSIWPGGVMAAVAWFQGDNDLGLPMWDPRSGAGFDGLHADRVNLNQGAESTLAVLATMQHARTLAPVAR
ncbi:glycosyltransferase [Mycolicibacterium parafortuitum]|uniref:Glycosyl transferase n=1 Tax=Mycolicibacterium parafortuitum TaxID=39692 RepID=A0A375YG49_MYCPF|nr:glycosyltransferase [Mycolicibacterium parafortuitum]ORB28811.1 glycosyltransferase [Mycolicibacterium parafortuitum]PQE01751.1 glycosyltransferase [Mycobacterium sp. EPG1]BBY73614.1 glycosyl transferase [Mycolicibacterium parafortuitum]SRX80087.1 glycosyltransferase [Rhodopirellula baltica SH 1] [Mycolicibacterium parafortuitum]